MRFLSQFAAGPRNYTEERSALFEHFTLEEIITEVRESEASRPED